MIDLLKYISEGITNYLIFVFTLLLLYMFVVATINVIFNKLMVAVITVFDLIHEKKKSEKN